MHGRSKGHDLTDGTPHAGQDRPVPGIHPQSAGGETRAVGRGRPRAVLGAGQAGLHPPSGARPVEALRRGLRQGRHVSDPDPDPRHSRLPDHAAHRHAWKGITVQLYLPKDDANTDIGTIFHERLPDGSMPKRAQMRFAPNTGYAFAVGTDTWHSADPVHNRVKTRDSILLTYFVDQGAAARSCATAASGWAISCSTKSGNTSRSEPASRH